MFNCVCVHACVCTCEYTRVCKYMRVCVCECVYLCVCVCVCVCVQFPLQMTVSTSMYDTPLLALAQKHLTNSLTRPWKQTNITQSPYIWLPTQRTHWNPWLSAHSHPHRPTHTHTLIHNHTHIQTHTQTQTHTHTHTHIQTHSHPHPSTPTPTHPHPHPTTLTPTPTFGSMATMPSPSTRTTRGPGLLGWCFWLRRDCKEERAGPCCYVCVAFSYRGAKLRLNAQGL